MNKKGDLTGLLFFIVSIAAFAIFLLIVAYIVPEIANPLKEQIGISTEINNSLNVTKAVAEHTLPTLWLIMFAGLMLGLFATSYFVPTHPIFVPIFVILLMVAIMVAIPLSNAYEALTEDVLLASTSLTQTTITFIMINLPYVAFIVGLISLVISFAKPGGQTTLA